MQPLTVMLVDKSRSRSDQTLTILQATGCKVIASLRPDQYLLEEVERYQPDMVIVDIDLPDRDILENLRSVQSNLPKPMVMFSQDDDGETIRRAVEAGVCGAPTSQVDGELFWGQDRFEHVRQAVRGWDPPGKA